MTDFSRLVAVVSIESVRLCEASCRSFVDPSEVAQQINVKASQSTEVVKAPGEDGSDGALMIRASFRMVASADADEEERQAEVRGVFELSYQVPVDETFSEDELEAFGSINAVFNAWPYWRELVQASLARMNMPVLTVPLYRALPREPENGGVGDAHDATPN